MEAFFDGPEPLGRPGDVEVPEQRGDPAIRRPMVEPQRSL